VRVDVLQVARRELRRIVADRYYLRLLVVLPAASYWILTSIFSAGVPRDLPVAVVDQDRGTLSRQLERAIDATSSMRVAARPDSIEAARALVLENRAYAVIVFPYAMERDGRRGQAPAVTGYLNAQALLPASLIRRDLRAAVSTVAAGLEVKARQARGEPPRVALARFEPVRLDYHTLFNPRLDYVSYLLTALLPASLQIFILLVAVHAVGGELKNRTARDWIDAAGGSAFRAAAGKLAPYAIYFTALGLAVLAALERQLGVPLGGSPALLATATVLFVLAYLAMGLALTAWFANLRLASSASAVYAAPAFAFVGITFPTMGMPAAGRVWGELLPLTHYLRALVDQGIRDAPAAVSLPSLAILAAFTVCGVAASLWRLRRVATDERYWGRL
jgi:ABC-2 type transport system permease protein